MQPDGKIRKVRDGQYDRSRTKAAKAATLKRRQERSRKRVVSGYYAARKGR